MLVDAKNCLLLVIDVQEKLLPAMYDTGTVLANAAILIKAARRLGIPVMATEQNPQGIGHTVDALASLLPPDSIHEKQYFSSLSEPLLGKHLNNTRQSHIVICGMEAQVCVLQTATELQAMADRQVFVVADATASRTELNHRLALARLERIGCVILSTEMAVFEWLRHSGREEFRELLALVK